MTEHTPTPWKYEPWHIQEGPSAVLAPEGWIICTTSSDENAAFIVKAVNNHQPLVDALKNVQSLISEAALTGFNCKDGDWAERLFESQQTTSRVLRAVVSSPSGSGK